MAMPRAMHSRCCWPPDRLLPLWVSLSPHLFPQRSLGQRPFDALVHFAAAKVFVQPHAERNVVVDRHRERRRFLEHHADLRTQQGHVLLPVEYVGAVEADLAFRPLTGYSSYKRLNVRSNVDLPQPEGR
jgi:hypothetical protein